MVLDLSASFSNLRAAISHLILAMLPETLDLAEQTVFSKSWYHHGKRGPPSTNPPFCRFRTCYDITRSMTLQAVYYPHQGDHHRTHYCPGTKFWSIGIRIYTPNVRPVLKSFISIPGLENVLLSIWLWNTDKRNIETLSETPGWTLASPVWDKNFQTHARFIPGYAV